MSHKKWVAEEVVELLTSKLAIIEMRSSRGTGFSSTNMYQIRFKPLFKEIDRELLIEQIYEILFDTPSLQLSNLTKNDRSPNSGKFKSISFDINSTCYDIVLALGSNNGEAFEKELLHDLQQLVAGHSESLIAVTALKALHSVDQVFSLNNIAAVLPRTGSTKRSANLPLHETGKIIADIITHHKCGRESFISVKNTDGKSVAQFGIAKAFGNDLSVNQETDEWKIWCSPFNLDICKIQDGLVAARDKSEINWSDIEEISIKNNEEIYKLMQNLWGLNYYYLRQKPSGFKALNINQEFIDTVLLKNLEVTQIRYPCKTRKQITIYLNSEIMKYKLEIRNPRGGTEIKPTQIQLVLMKDDL